MQRHMYNTITQKPAEEGVSVGAIIFAALAFLVLFLSCALAVMELTEHARASHSTQTWNATTIQEYIHSGKCRPEHLACFNKSYHVEFCEIKPGLSIGLIIGSVSDVIITGFAARTTYWRSRCR